MDKKYSGGDQVFATNVAGMELPKAGDDAQVAVVPAPGEAAPAME